MAGVGLPYTLRKHWKKSVAASVAFLYGLSYVSRKFRENLQRRKFCRESKLYGEEIIQTPTSRPRTLYVFLNPHASGGKARKLFEKNAAPILHLAGMDVTVVEPSGHQQLRMLMDYIPVDVDGIVVAGGRGTMMEVVSGLMLRKDKEKLSNVPLGYIPLGGSHSDIIALLGLDDNNKVIETCKATLAVVKGHTRVVDVMQIEPAGSKPVFALNSLEWGILSDINERIPKFWWTWKMRRFAACLEAVLKVALMSNFKKTQLQYRSVLESVTNTAQHKELEIRSRTLFGHQLSWLPTISAQSSDIGISSENSEDRGGADTSNGCAEELLECVSVTVQCNKAGVSPGLNLSHCLVSVDRLSLLSNGLNQGHPDLLPLQDLSEIITVQFTPDSHLSPWMRIDGEEYESRPVTIQWLPGRLQMFHAVQ